MLFYKDINKEMKKQRDEKKSLEIIENFKRPENLEMLRPRILSPIESIASMGEVKEILDELRKSEFKLDHGLDRESSYLVPKSLEIRSEYFKKESSFFKENSEISARKKSGKSRNSSACSSIKLLAEGE